MVWDIYIHVLYPLPVFLLLLLCLPVPSTLRHSYRRYSLRFIDFVLFRAPSASHPMITVSFLWTLMSTLALAITGLQAYRAYSQRELESVGVLSQHRCLRWRAERNMWISALAVVLWLCLYRIRVLMKECEEKEAVGTTGERNTKKRA